MSGNTHTISIVGHSTAADMIEVVIDHAKDNGWKVAAVVVDPWGAIIASGRMDGVVPAILEFAHDKAYTSALGKTSKAFFERMSSTPDLTLGLQNRPRLCAWEGGVPIYENDSLVGAIGVSGAEGDEDAGCASFAVEKFGFATKI